MIDLIITDSLNEYKIYCKNEDDLSIDRILITLAAIKDALQQATIFISYSGRPQCIMTPIIKNRILEANKKRKMYGKTSSIIIPHFFDNFKENTLSNKTNNICGIIIKIVSPEEYGELHLELKIIKK